MKITKYSKKTADFIKEVESKLGKEILIKDSRLHKDAQLKSSSFLENDVIFTDFSFNLEKQERKINHELAHVYIKLQDNYPKVTFKKPFTQKTDQITLDKILSLAEDLIVNEVLNEKDLPRDEDDFYDSVMAKIKDFSNTGKYFSVAKVTGDPTIDLLHNVLMFVRLLIDAKFKSEDKQIIVDQCRKMLGVEGEQLVNSLSSKIMTHLSSKETKMTTLGKMFSTLIGQFNLVEYVSVNE